MSDGIYTPLGEQGNNLLSWAKQLLGTGARAGRDAANPDP